MEAYPYLTGYLTKVRESRAAKLFRGKTEQREVVQEPYDMKNFRQKALFTDKRKDVCERI